MSNIIKQLVDSNGNNIYPLAYAMGGAKMDLLWTNPNPTSNYTANTESMDLSDYDLIYVEFANTDADKITVVCRADGKTYIATQPNKSSGATSPSVNRYRTFTVNTSGISFGTAYIAGTTSAANGACVPQAVYGLKFSWIVPTEVHGLQYIEV